MTILVQQSKILLLENDKMSHTAIVNVTVVLFAVFFFFFNLLVLCHSYDNDGTSKDEIKERFCQTMEFVENYLRDVVCQSFPFADKEKNKLTFEVSGSSSNLPFFPNFCPNPLAYLTHLCVSLLGRQPR